MGPAGEVEVGMKDICKHANARLLPHVFDVGLVLACSGAIVSSLMIIGDSLLPLATSDSTGEVHINRQEWILMVFCLFAFPLSCLKQLAFLRFTSYLSLIMVVYIVGLVVVSAIYKDFPEYSAAGHREEGQTHLIRWDNMIKVLQAVPCFTFCFCGHMNMLPIVSEVINPTLLRIDTIITAALFTAGVIYGTSAIAAYESFGDNTPEDLLTFYPSTMTVKFARVGMAVVCTAFYPLLVQPIRRTLIGLVLRFKCGFGHSSKAVGGSFRPSPGSNNSSQHGASLSIRENPVTETSDLPSPLAPRVDSSSSPDTVEGGSRAELAPSPSTFNNGGSWMASVAYWAMTVLIGGVALGIALSTKSLGKVFSLSGATGFALLCNICPAWAYLSLVPERSFTRILAWFLLAFGLVTMPVCVIANLIA
jgi:amino acid permease